VLGLVGDKSVLSSQTIAFAVHGTDPDGDALTYAATGLPSGATLNAATGAFSWKPTSSQVGTHAMTFRTSDGELVDAEQVRIFVAAGAGQFTVTPLVTTLYETSPGKPVTVSFQVRNVGEVPDVIDLAASAAPSWAPVLSATSVSLAPGQAATVTIKTTPTAAPLESQVILVGTSAISGRVQNAATVRVPVVVAVAFDEESYGVTAPVTGRVTMTYKDGTPAAGQLLQLGEAYSIGGLLPVGEQRRSVTLVGSSGSVSFSLPVNAAGANMPGHHQFVASALGVVSDASSVAANYFVAN
ncbi:MAG TPA: putative Ig domain-containing protein, partial [Candidatus Thermoplasmatota archaeon]|nr:putative Ig domain-containing protein [Candidatus Thermoplasmatota archaeon]